MKDYVDFTQVDFIEDEYFFEWVTCPSEKSQNFWDGFINTYPAKCKEIERAKLIIKSMIPVENDLPEAEIDLLWKRVRRSINERGNNRQFLWYPIAAALILIFILCTWWILTQNHRSYELVDYSQILPVNIVEQDVELILADQTKLKISEKESELKYDASGKVFINSEKSIQQKSEKRTSGQELFNSIVVPRGKRASITFTDGTKLWLNSGSHAIYPVVFSGEKREIYISGEGYLEVAHDESRPFIVKTEKMDVQVLGTSFNVTAYPEDAATRVILVKGKVITRSINSPEVILLPNQMISYDNQTQKAEVKEVNIEDYISWKDGWLLCDSEELGSLVEKLERYYNLKIIITSENARYYRLSGKLDLKDDLDQVLQVIATTAPVKIKVENDIICISSN
jgi:hypothetical protein